MNPAESPQDTAISVIIPVLNEEENIPQLYDELLRVLAPRNEPFEIVFVNDGSSDGTAAALTKIATADERVKVIELRRSFGQTAALAAGMHFSQGRVLITMDGDLQNDPADIPFMLSKLDEGYDLIQGWRKNRQDAYLSRSVPSKVANVIIARVTGIALHDIGCSFKIIKREIVDDIQIYGEMHRFIPILAHWRGAKCLEVVTNHRARTKGSSKYGISRTLSVLLDLITVKFMIRYLKNPMRLFGGMGLACIVVGLLSAAMAVFMKFFDDFSINRNPLFFLAIFFLIISVQFFFMGMLGELIMRIYYDNQKKRIFTVRRTMNVTHHA